MTPEYRTGLELILSAIRDAPVKELLHAWKITKENGVERGCALFTSSRVRKSQGKDGRVCDGSGAATFVMQTNDEVPSASDEERYQYVVRKIQDELTRLKMEK